MPRNLSPVLLARIDRLSGCQGRWIVDCREIDGDYSYALRPLSDPWPILTPEGQRYWHATAAGSDDNPHKLGSLEDAALYCAHTGWQSRLLFVSDYLREDCSWPGGYSPSAVYRSNARVFRDEFSKELAAGADGDGPDIALDVRYVTDEMLETLDALENHPLISEDDHSELEMEDQQEAWDSWAASDWRRAVESAIDDLLPENLPFDGDDLLNRVEDAKLQELFRACAEAANKHWFEDGDCGQYIRMEPIIAKLDDKALEDLTGLPLRKLSELVILDGGSPALDPDQQWRTEPYPWPDGSTEPLIKAEVL